MCVCIHRKQANQRGWENKARWEAGALSILVTSPHSALVQLLRAGEALGAHPSSPPGEFGPLQNISQSSSLKKIKVRNKILNTPSPPPLSSVLSGSMSPAAGATLRVSEALPFLPLLSCPRKAISELLCPRSQQGGWWFYFCPACPKIVVLSFPGAAKYFTGCLVSWRGVGNIPSLLPSSRLRVSLAEVFPAQPVRASHHRVFKVLKRWDLLTVREIKEIFSFPFSAPLEQERSAREGLGAGCVRPLLQPRNESPKFPP